MVNVVIVNVVMVNVVMAYKVLGLYGAIQRWFVATIQRSLELPGVWASRCPVVAS